MSSDRPRPQWLVTGGVPESLREVAGHQPVDGITRFRLFRGLPWTGAIVHCAVHFVSEEYSPGSEWRYTQPQAHEFDEVNILVSERGQLRFRYEVDGATEMVESPSTVFLPAGTTHRMEAAGGTGTFICIHLKREGSHGG